MQASAELGLAELKGINMRLYRSHFPVTLNCMFS